MNLAKSLPAALVAAWLGIVAGLSQAIATTGDISGHIDADTGQIRVEQNSVTLLETELMFWRGEWDWLGPPMKATAAAGNRGFDIAGRHVLSRLDVTGQVQPGEQRPDRATIRMRLKIEELPEGSTDSFGGIVFKVNPEHAAPAGRQPVPVLNASRTGWTLDLGPGRTPLTVSFNRPVSRLEFERGNPREIRAYLFERNTRRDQAEIEVDVTFPGKMVTGPRERLSRTVGWWPISDLHWNRSPVDLSHLNKPEVPAGKRGHLRVEGERLVFADGTPARFWGTNVAAYSLFDYINQTTVRSQARRLSQLGFNLVRIHHHDSAWVAPNVFGRDAERTRKLADHQMNSIHWWVKSLKEEGIYVWIDLHVGREVTRADDVEAIDEIAGRGKRGGMQGYLYLNKSLQERSAEFATEYLSHKSPYTGLALKDDPAVIAVLITNENDITGHFSHNVVSPGSKPWHTARYLEMARASKAARGLDRDALLRIWEHGQVRLVLGDIEHRYFSDITRRLRDLGVKAPIVTTNYWGDLPVSSLPSLAAGDMLDVHVYAKFNELQHNPRFRPGSLSWIAAGAVAGKPLTVSEWNVEAPDQQYDRTVLPLHISAIAGFQGWPAMMQYAYAQNPLLGDGSVGSWNGYADPAVLATTPAAALLYRAGHVKEGADTTILQLPPAALAGSQTDPSTSRALRTLVERTRMRVGLPALPGLDWHSATPTPAGAKVVGDLDFDAVGPNTSKVCSDTGEVCRDWQSGILTIDTPRSQIAAGWIGGKSVETADVSFRITEAAAAVAVQSLGDKPIAEAAELMISLSAQALTVHPGRGPFRSEPVTGELSIRARPGLKLFRLDLDGKPKPVAAAYRDGRYAIKLRAEEHGHWWIMR